MDPILALVACNLLATAISWQFSQAAGRALRETEAREGLPAAGIALERFPSIVFVCTNALWNVAGHASRFPARERLLVATIGALWALCLNGASYLLFQRPDARRWKLLAYWLWATMSVMQAVILYAGGHE